MRFAIILAAMVFAVTAATVSAQGRGNGQAKKTTVTAPKAKSTQAAKQTARQTKKADTRVSKADARAAKTTAKADARAARTTAKTETRATKTETRATKLNPNQEAKLVARLPEGMTVQDAAKGFKNWGQFQAAVNASTNHNISFVELKSKMTGIAPGATDVTMTPMSLGQALQSFGITDTTTP